MFFFKQMTLIYLSLGYKKKHTSAQHTHTHHTQKITSLYSIVLVEFSFLYFWENHFIYLIKNQKENIKIHNWE